MSSLVLRRLRGMAGTMLTWSVGGGILGAVGGAAIWLGVRLVNGEAMHVPSVVLGMGLVGAIVGAVSGLAGGGGARLSARGDGRGAERSTSDVERSCRELTAESRL
jgi:hypothetical protein